jgi:hypothetical protein
LRLLRVDDESTSSHALQLSLDAVYNHAYMLTANIVIKSSNLFSVSTCSENHQIDGPADDGKHWDTNYADGMILYELNTEKYYLIGSTGRAYFASL